MFKRFFCKHDPELVKLVAIVNGRQSSYRIAAICRKCNATNIMSRELAKWREKMLANPNEPEV